MPLPTLCSAPQNRIARRAATIRWLLTTWAVALGGCRAEVASDVTEQSAQQIRSALSAHSVPSDRIAQAGSDDRFAVRVAREDEIYAAAILSRHQLPRPASPDLASLLNDGPLIPSRSEQHLRWLLGTAAELEQTLEQHPNVLTARVHLASAKASVLGAPFDEDAPSASVFLRVSAEPSPVDVRETQRLIAGAVLGLTPARVTVVSSQAPALPSRNTQELVRWGPITTTRGSMSSVQWVFSLVIALNLFMTALVLVLWRHRSATRRAQPSLSRSERG